jgi:hypothetical protein
VTSDIRILLSCSRRWQPSARVACRYLCPELVELGFQKIVRDQQRLDRFFGVAAAGRDGLICGGVQAGGGWWREFRTLRACAIVPFMFLASRQVAISARALVQIRES